MVETEPLRSYTIKLESGTVFENAVRTRSVWNDSKTGRFLAYAQQVIEAKRTEKMKTQFKQGGLEMQKESKVEKLTEQVQELLLRLQELEAGETALKGSHEEMVHLYRLLVFMHGSSINVAESLSVSEEEAWKEKK